LDELFLEAESAFETLDFERAVKCYEEIVKRYPSDSRAAEAQFLIGFVYANDIGDIPLAKEAYTTFLDNFSTSSDRGMVLSAQWELANLNN